MKVLWLVLGMVLLAGCETHRPMPNDPRYAPAMPVRQVGGDQSTGSIYASGTGISLWEDQRARRIGDIITIVLSEQTVSQKSSSSELSKNDRNNMGVNSLLGTVPQASLPGVFNSNSKLGFGVDTTNNRDFEGESSADQSNRLQGNISVTVVDVLANGVLVVRGEKWMTLTQGDEFIRIEGLLRPADIAPDNTVESKRMADARITYSGSGELADANKRGWLSRFFSSPAWPF